jgi:RecA/RadA recombinase
MNTIRIRISGKAGSGKTLAMDHLVKNLCASGHTVQRQQEGPSIAAQTFLPTKSAKRGRVPTLFKILEVQTRK